MIMTYDLIITLKTTAFQRTMLIVFYNVASHGHFKFSRVYRMLPPNEYLNFLPSKSAYDTIHTRIEIFDSLLP